ncbi:MAG: hypothetical protein N3F08_00590 [Crenarchaeota archaeon]|nr:hypothetical protein [Thermoproteota archaeon]
MDSEMTQWGLVIRISSKASPEATRELKGLKWLDFGWESIEIMMMKGLRYLPTIVYTASRIDVSNRFCVWTPTLLHERLSQQYTQEIERTFNFLSQRVRVWIIRSSEKPDFARWPCEILDLKEVQDEISWLAIHDLMSKDNPKDREIAKIIASRLYWGRELTFEEKIDDVIDDENHFGKRFADFFSRATEIHRKYPKSRFWFYAVFE